VLGTTPLTDIEWQSVVNAINGNHHFNALIKGVSAATKIPMAYITKEPRTTTLNGKPFLNDDWRRDKQGRPVATTFKVRVTVDATEHLNEFPTALADIDKYLAGTAAQRAVAGLAKRFRIARPEDVKVLVVRPQPQPQPQQKDSVK
jgi:hypothetical protein